jgi:murein DD-endopeptidase MepM/ murein hydrolase activator NlpD
MSDIIEIDTTKELVHFAGVIEDSLWASAVGQNLSPEVIQSFAEVFGWQVDFNREVRKGDRWRFTVEKLFANDRHVGWGNILFAEYFNGPEHYKAYFYKNQAKEIQGYFDSKGDSLRKVFLKSPIKFGRITSGFSRRRFHPIHKRYKAHNGIDYGAPRGTPIRAVGDGRIVKIGRYGGSGKMVVVDHIAGYKTKYLHMSRFARGMRRGRKILQGQIIGYVGATGYATGPHLHFEMWKHNRVMNPQKVNLPAADPVPEELVAHFKSYIGNLERSVAAVHPVDQNNPTHSVDLKTRKSQME